MVDTNSQEDLRPFLDKIMSFIGNLNDSQVLTCDEECKRKQSDAYAIVNHMCNYRGHVGRSKVLQSD